MCKVLVTEHMPLQFGKGQRRTDNDLSTCKVSPRLLWERRHAEIIGGQSGLLRCAINERDIYV
jgi:hypothetical protein